jgi:phosphoenolpyruvate synthase/pyruvate phosphate dikinase
MPTAEAKMARCYIRWLEDIYADDVASVGGKNASLGEMVRNLGCYDIKVPPGFAITADSYRHFLSANNLEAVIARVLLSTRLTISSIDSRSGSRALPRRSIRSQ